ncbi:hypothetical protein EC957_010663 [Mortierella hygrophila]|uniref:Core Histone H2A/H2B/H3 domain-containing protein n=1 Tax=Mortierella hygrophila TaxID=979708 RepID=A0A9P6K4K1_9FUNG|nr:hypothetical protein EC957_010663 [Mortierella hygrophila]
MYDTYHQQAAAAQASSSSRSNLNDEAADTADGVPATAVATTGAANTTLHRQQQQFAQDFWEEQIVAAEQYDSDFKNHPLPLARIKKVMKSDPEVKMISAEAPILFSKACEIFICEITRRAWLHAEENKRRTLQRSDVANAVSRSDQFDFLIDIVPREEPAKPSHKKSSTREDVAPEAEAYDDQQQQPYAQYYQQPAGGLPGYPHAIDPQFYQAVSHDQFQQYMQYQAAYQTPPTSTGAGAAAAAAATSTTGGASPPPHTAGSATSGSRNGYAQEAGAARQN